MRSSVVPFIAVALLLGLVFLLPEREGGPGGPVGARLMIHLRPLELTQPPTWAVGQGTDAIRRQLDRLYWANHEATQHAREALRLRQGQLLDEVMARLARLGDGDPIPVQKLLDVLSDEDLEAPGVLEELIKRAWSESGLVSGTALRILARHPDDGATAGIYPRLNDDNLQVRAHARAALARRARNGDREAQRLILEELEQHPSQPDLAYLATTDSMEDPAVDGVLDAVSEQADETARWMALTVQLRRGRPEAEVRVLGWLEKSDTASRVNALRAAVAAERVVGDPPLWETIAATQDRMQALALADMLLLAVDSGHPDADDAILLLERMAANQLGNSGAEVTSALLRRSHPTAIEVTRQELQSAVGTTLAQAVDRILAAPHVEWADFVAVAVQRLEDPGLDPGDRVLLLRLVSHAAPDRAVEPVVEALYTWAEDRPELASNVLAYMDRLGPSLLDRLASEVGTPLGDALFVYAAAQVRSGQALPELERIILDEKADPAVRLEAMDTVARLDDGPREETLRRVALELTNPALRERARLLYWNYL